MILMLSCGGTAALVPPYVKLVQQLWSLWSRKNCLHDGLIYLYLLATQPPRLWGFCLTRNLGGFFVPAVLADVIRSFKGESHEY